MKKIVWSMIIIGALVSCKKTSPVDDTEGTLVVEEKNMSVVAKRTATWCGPCGDWGFPAFELLEDEHEGTSVLMAWKDAFVTTTGSDLFDAVGPQFSLGGSVPTFFNNFQASNGDSLIEQHNEGFVTANSNYELEVNGQNVSLKTTTKFFTDVEGVYYLAPYMIVDGIVGYQNGHPDGANTVHHKYVAGIAKPVNVFDDENFGYQITSNGARMGQTVNLDFTMKRDVTWDAKDISFGVVIFKQESWGLQFVNAFTK
jgi:hypothetical protein